MIEVRIDRDALDKINHDVQHSIYVIDKLKKAGIPIRGNLITRGVERGRLTWHNDDGLDGIEWVIRWFDDGEKKPAAGWKVAEKGKGESFTWTRFVNPETTEDEEL